MASSRSLKHSLMLSYALYNAPSGPRLNAEIPAFVEETVFSIAAQSLR